MPWIVSPKRASACPHNPFYTHGNPSTTAPVIHVHETTHELCLLGGQADKNHRTGTEKANLTLLLPNSVAKSSFPTPSLMLHPQKHLPSREGLSEQTELGCTEAAVGTAERQLRKGLMKTSFVGYFSASCCFKCIPVYIVSVAATSLAFLGPLLDPLAEIRMFGIAVVLPWLRC